MAEAGATTQHRFFCHCCKCEIEPKLPDLICPMCDSGFVEEVPEDSSLLIVSAPVDSDDTNAVMSELWQLMIMERSALLTDLLTSGTVSNMSHGVTTNDNVPAVLNDASEVLSETQDLREPESSLLQPRQDRRSSQPDQTPAMEGIVQQFLAGLFTNNGSPGYTQATLNSMLQLHSNPGDYTWGQRGLDSVITELIGQLDSTGPPPAEREIILSLPTVSVSQEQTDCRMECPVCREEFSLGESVKKLPCLHIFHCDCIVPWLELHDTCPVCRTSLEGNSLPPTSELPDPLSISREQQEEQAMLPQRPSPAHEL